ncbi:MAG: hypothetical protein Q9220_003973 [cf. Caloplaca sp. 1 TL-2023]
MSAFRHCCRNPRSISPNLPNVQLVLSPTQVDGYDADAVPLQTPNEFFVGSLHLHPGVDEPRPSSETVVHNETLERSRSNFEQDTGIDNQAATKRLKVERVNSIHVPRRRSHAKSQPLPSISAAAGNQYIKISPSRAALAKRLEAIKVINDLNQPSSPKLAPTRGASIPESAVSSQWRLSYNKGSSSFRRPGLSANGYEEQSVDEVEHRSFTPNLGLGNVNANEDRVTETVPTSRENERHVVDPAPLPYDGVMHQLGLESQAKVPRKYVMPGSYQSESTAASVHLYDMQITERVASSNSNIAQPGDLMTRRRSSTTEHNPLLSMRASRYKGSMESYGLQSPGQSSSLYPSDDDDLAVSRRNSVLLIQSLPERIQRLKCHATSGDLYSSSEKHSEVTVVARSRFPTTFADGSKYNGSNGNETYLSDVGSDCLYERKDNVQNPSLRRSSTEPRLNRFKRGAPASFDGSGEWHLSPPSRQPTGLGCRLPTGLLVPEDASSVWERALQEHANEDHAISRARLGSISYEIGRDDLKRRARSRRFTRTPSPLQDIREDPWSQRRGYDSQLASGRVSPTQGTSGRTFSTQGDISARKTSGQISSRPASSSARSVESWTRYPSHTHRERTEAANLSDNVIARDFAMGQPVERQVSKKKSRSMTFGKSMLHKIGRIYRTRSSDFRRYNAGHRSSISVGGVLEYPELEIPRPSFEPVLLSGPRETEIGDTNAQVPVVPKKDKVIVTKSTTQHSSTEISEAAMGSASPAMSEVDWKKEYEDCVVHARNTSTDEEVAPDEIVPQSSVDEELDAVRQADVDQAREAVLQAADDCYRRSMETERYPKRV